VISVPMRGVSFCILSAEFSLESKFDLLGSAWMPRSSKSKSGVGGNLVVVS
jgi:hypothetical protein